MLLKKNVPTIICALNLAKKQAQGTVKNNFPNYICQELSRILE